MNSTKVQDSESPVMEQKGKPRSCVTNNLANQQNQIGMIVSDLIYGQEFTVIFHYLVYQSCSVLPYSYNFYSTGAHLRTF